MRWRHLWNPSSEEVMNKTCPRRWDVSGDTTAKKEWALQRAKGGALQAEAGTACAEPPGRVSMDAWAQIKGQCYWRREPQQWCEVGAGYTGSESWSDVWGLFLCTPKSQHIESFCHKKGKSVFFFFFFFFFLFFFFLIKRIPLDSRWRMDITTENQML